MQFESVECAVESIIKKTSGKIILGIPLGMGKPNPLVNLLYAKAKANSELSLTIITALSLSKPSAKGELQQRFLSPFIERIYADYEELAYLQDARLGKLPSNITINEFFVQPASELNNHYTQQNYINSNYTHVARDMNARGVNVVAQTISRRYCNHSQQFSLSCNPEVILDLLPRLSKRKQMGEAIFIVGQVHKDLPFIENSASVSDDFFDIIIDDPNYDSRLISTPNMPVGMAEHFIGLIASTLIKDGGTLQIGIGALGDAVANAVLQRHNNNPVYKKIVNDIQLTQNRFPILAEGNLDSFSQGLYACSEMFTYGLFMMFKAGVIKRQIVDGDGRHICIHGGFFLGPNAFYQGLHDLSPLERSQIDMTNISFVNSLYGNEELKRNHRLDARFINTAFSVTLMGAAIADQLEDGRMLSGVGGQYNFVAQAHELEGARSIILVRATRVNDDKVCSNILWNYGHTTIPRHLRDVVVTEYGIADLRGKTDGETIAAMLNICDSRFQDELINKAKSMGKLPFDYEIPKQFTNNTPQRLQLINCQYTEVFSAFPLGSDFTYVEEMLLVALDWLKHNMKLSNALEIAKASFIDEETERHFQPHLERMGYKEAESIEEKLYRQLLLVGLTKTANIKNF
jgi:acyl-CoA hydrolase